MDVLLILGAFQLRGSYTRAMSLIERLPSDSVRLTLASSDPIRVSPARRRQIETRFSHYLHWPVLGYFSRRFLAKDLLASPPDLIDIQHRKLHALGLWMARQLHRPYIVTVHDYLRERERFVIDPKWCRRVIAVSESVRSELLDHTRLPEEMVTVIPSGVVPPKEEELSKILSPGRCPVIGTTGPLEAGKGLQFFLQSATHILKTHPHAMFVIAGSGPEERSLRRMGADLNISHALTILPNLHDFGPALRAMDIFVLPALKQGLGSTMLDAMARALPVIGTESGGVYSVVADGTTGLLVPPSNELALAEKIRFLIDNPERARELGQAARRRVVEQFHVDRMIENTVRLYQQVSATAS